MRFVPQLFCLFSVVFVIKLTLFFCLLYRGFNVDHRFCKACAEKLLHSGKCPLCRAEVFEIRQDERLAALTHSVLSKSLSSSKVIQVGTLSMTLYHSFTSSSHDIEPSKFASVQFKRFQPVSDSKLLISLQRPKQRIYKMYWRLFTHKLGPMRSL